METIDLTPNWETAVKIYIEVLQNENASAEGKQSAKEELLYLARYVDDMRLEKKLEAIKESGWHLNLKLYYVICMYYSY